MNPHRCRRVGCRGTTPHARLLSCAPMPARCRPVTGWVCFASRALPNRDEFAAVEALSEHGDLREAAASLFAAMRRLDGLGLDFIVARPLPEHGLGQAIMDRLTRASSQLSADLASASRGGSCDGP